MLFLFCGHSILKWLQNSLISCPFKKISGFDCPFCGLQRSVLELLQGHLSESVLLYPATIPLLFAVGLSVSRERHPQASIIVMQKVVFICCGLIMVGFYLWKIAGMS